MASKWNSQYLRDLRVRPYLHDTVTSILVAGTLVLRGSNSPIDAIISTQDADENPQRKKNKNKTKPTDHSRQDRDGSKSIIEIFLWFFVWGAESSGGWKETENGTDRPRDRVPGGESWEADLKFIHPSRVHGALPMSVRRRGGGERSQPEEPATTRCCVGVSLPLPACLRVLYSLTCGLLLLLTH